MLGYTPYHMIDVMFKGRSPHMKVFTEAIIANHNQLSGIKRYETLDLERWVGNYDVSLAYISPYFSFELPPLKNFVFRPR